MKLTGFNLFCVVELKQFITLKTDFIRIISIPKILTISINLKKKFKKKVTIPASSHIFIHICYVSIIKISFIKKINCDLHILCYSLFFYFHGT